MRLIFIHHSTGENWLRDGYGDLGRTLGENNYFVSDTNYGWGPDSIGDRTDILNWTEWFGQNRNQAALEALYAESGQNSEYTRTLPNPGGENQIIMFKSCFPNSDLGGNPDDPPSADLSELTVGSAKYVYNEILQYFASWPDKMFVVITAPPVSNPDNAANARAFNLWLVNDWLAGYGGNNVFVFDFYNILTGKDHHHRLRDGVIEHTYTPGKNTLVYPSSGGDDHPNEAGSRKATEEFVPLLNAWYHLWQAGAPAQPPETEVLPTAAVEEPVEEEPGEEPGENPPSIIPAGDFLFDFEAGATGWNSYRDDSSQIECTAAANPAGDGSVLRLSYQLSPEGWAGCGVDFDVSQNWSQAEGISFLVHASQADQPFTLILWIGSSEGTTPFEAHFTTGKASVSGWEAFFVPWSGLNRASWADEGGYQTFDPTLVMSLYFDIGGAQSGQQYSLWVDDIRLGASGIPQEQEEEQQVLPSEAADTEVPVQTSPQAAEPTPARVRERLCGGAAMPLGMVLATWLLRRKRRENAAGQD
uniref:CBM11 domain-containing protein n=1 Tax=Bellilinea caldifistulae TaxID=360411 RepID=A0A7C4L1F9_9CHLR